jgi:hypothetical protein
MGRDEATVAGVTHLILTRFSVKAGAESPAFAPDWLDDRLALLEAYCLPGVAGQTCADFRWLLFCDDSTDRSAVRRLRELVGPVAGAEVVLVDPQRSALARILADAATGVLLTTRLDSDDGLALGFVERQRQYVRPFLASGHEALLINFAHGYKLAEDGVYATYNPHSAFMTLCERVGPGRRPLSVLTGNHGYLHIDYPLYQDLSMPGWVQVVHGGNVSNRVSRMDVRVPAGALDQDFALRSEAVAHGSRVAAPQPSGTKQRAAFRQRLEEALLPPESHAPGAWP